MLLTLVNGMHFRVSFLPQPTHWPFWLPSYYDGATLAEFFHFFRVSREAFAAALARHEYYLAAQIVSASTCAIYRGEGFAAALARHEHYPTADRLRPGMRDVGCGVGGPAMCHRALRGRRVAVLNSNEFQLQLARRYTKRAHLDGKIGATS
ncbi:hypothetical protein B0H12DRAFT_1236787 [Mycena haematopus]|nr:hypothetical protein B0H12DRAFT_1236787 [Mycena haematopus]